MSKLIIDCETGLTVERELNKSEKDQQKIDEAAINLEQIASEAKATAKAALLARLGITVDEAKLLLA